ncbi:SPOR domain-containing protein [Shimia sp.]|uniref:SPOR domain-containing protein n=1 Tax=Shimia sp. TaxID=1954381 RepID=UPI003299357E
MQFDQQSSLGRGSPGQIVRVGEVHPDTRVVPLHVYEKNLHTNVATDIPDGYRLAFDDGRLNPRRAEMTFSGMAQSNRIWTQKVPRKMVDRRTGEEIVMPATTTYGTSTTSGSQQVARSSYSPATAPVVSTKSEPTQKALRLSGTPYVQVGTYGSAQQAQAVAKEVQQLGLPVRIGKYTRQGTTQRMVLAGPFASSNAAGSALSKTRRAGFSDAFLRQ